MSGDDDSAAPDEPRRIPAPLRRPGVPPPASRDDVPDHAPVLADPSETDGGLEAEMPVEATEDEVVPFDAASDDAAAEQIAEPVLEEIDAGEENVVPPAEEVLPDEGAEDESDLDVATKAADVSESIEVNPEKVAEDASPAPSGPEVEAEAEEEPAALEAASSKDDPTPADGEGQGEDASQESSESDTGAEPGMELADADEVSLDVAGGELESGAEPDSPAAEDDEANPAEEDQQDDELPVEAPAVPVLMPKAEPKEDGTCPFEKVLLVGTGNMGAPMAAHLAEYVPNLHLFDLNQETAEAAAKEAGCEAENGLADGARGADCIILMLPNGDIVRRVLLEAIGDQLRDNSALGQGTVVIDMSSSYPMTTVKTGEVLAKHRALMCDAPVSGGVRRAQDASLTIMLGGESEEAVELVQPMLESMGKVYRTGGLGSGHAMKILNNYLSAVGLTAASEAVLIGQKFGLSGSVMIDIINNSTGRNNATDLKFHQHILNGKFASGFHLDLMAKDLTGAAQLAEELEMDAGGLQREAELWQDASSAFERGADHTEVFKFIEAQIDSEGT